ncbi:hypothetical protein [Lactobacillus intestinalis]|uniref:hypothetical protein n=1 Tax=Lactobacillus intestinalis TaxID=151781 RepID=UPI0025A9B70C|nr:hypothetical protein [Lactobacillus intestinalis]
MIIINYIYNFNQIFTTLTTIGGVGIINYLIAEKIGALDQSDHNSNTMKYLSVVFTSLDSVLYLLIQTILKEVLHLKGNWLVINTAWMTIVVSVVLMLLLSNPLHKIFYWCINRIRGIDNKVETTSTTTWKELYEGAGNRSVFIYCYNFQHEPLGWGYLSYISKDPETNFSLNLVPPTNSDQEDQTTYEELVKQLGTKYYKENYRITQHVNFKHQFIVFSLIKNEN